MRTPPSDTPAISEDSKRTYDWVDYLIFGVCAFWVVGFVYMVIRTW